MDDLRQCYASHGFEDSVLVGGIYAIDGTSPPAQGEQHLEHLNPVGALLIRHRPGAHLLGTIQIIARTLFPVLISVSTLQTRTHSAEDGTRRADSLVSTFPSSPPT